MKRFTLATASAAAFLLFALPAVAGQLVVVCKEARKVAFFDAQTYEPLGTADTGRGAREIAVTPSGRWAFVGDFDDLENTVSMFDVRARTMTKRIKVPNVWGPHDLAVSSDGKLLYVTCEKSRAVAVMDIATKTFRNNYTTTMRGGHTLTLLPDDSALYVANCNDDNVTVYKTDTGVIDRHILVGDYPEGLAARPDGREVWVPCQGSNRISIIDTETRKVSGTIQCPGSPTRVEFTPDGTLALVTCTSSGQVTMFDTTKREAVGSVRTGDTPWGVAVDPNGKRAYVANAASSTVSVIDLATREVVGQFDTPAMPAGIAYVE